MSGGSMNYFYGEVEDVAKVIMRSTKNPMRIAFGKHLLNISKALHDIEWVDSDDYGEGDEESAIRNVLGEHWKELTIEAALEQIDKIRMNLELSINYQRREETDGKS